MSAHLVEDLHRFVELYIPQERGQVLEEINQQLCVHGPALQEKNKIIISPKIQEARTNGEESSNVSYLLLRRVCEHPGDEDAMGDELQPGVHKAGCFGGSQDVEGIAAVRKERKGESQNKVP